MKKAVTIIIIIILFLSLFGIGVWFLAKSALSHQVSEEERAAAAAQNDEIQRVLNSRRDEAEKTDESDPFGEDNILRVLFLGLDRRTGDPAGHCDAIQLITVDKEKQEVTITAVPRGTYSPLPPGGKYLPSDYYLSNACAVGGLEYGIGQIEKVLGQKADYLVIVGFSEVLGIFRNLDLPTTETLQWLRQRQGYAIGEPQRAHNHSTFIKQMMIKYVPEKSSTIDKALQYIIYKTIKTDLSFSEARKIVDILGSMNLAENTSRIRLVMRPAYIVQDIPYAEEYLGEYIDKMINPVKNFLSDRDYSGMTEEEIQANLLEIIDEKKDDPKFIVWAFENNLWLQIEDRDKRLSYHYDFMEKYTLSLDSGEERENVIADYILEMEYFGEEDWAQKGRDLLQEEIGQ